MTEKHENSRRRRAARRTILGTFACLCFALQQFLVPGHLALNDHVSPSDSQDLVNSHGEHDHGGTDHHHGRAPSEQGDSDEDHTPHPVEDHLAQIAEPSVPPNLVYTVIAPAPAERWHSAFDLPLCTELQALECGPRPPPPIITAAPRAPPIVV